MSTTIRNEKLFCDRCGAYQYIPLPINVSLFSAMAKAFSKSHKNCKQTYIEPVADPKLTTVQRQKWWLENGELGVSSETIFSVLAFPIIHNTRYCHPLDPDDFRRCYLLLKTIPEWKEQMYKMCLVSPVWDNLVQNWDKLTEILEEQLKTNKPNGMYEFMKSLGA